MLDLRPHYSDWGQPPSQTRPVEIYYDASDEPSLDILTANLWIWFDFVLRAYTSRRVRIVIIYSVEWIILKNITKYD